jgi:hypothetical protein
MYSANEERLAFAGISLACWTKGRVQADGLRQHDLVMF